MIRRATTEDARALSRLGTDTFVETFGHLYSNQNLQAFLEAGRAEAVYARLLDDPHAFVALALADDGEPQGYVVAGSCKLPVPDVEPRAGEVRELYLLARHQGNGLGTRLLAAALEWLAEQSRAPLYVGVWSENVGAQRLYARYGFEKIGEYDFPVGAQLDREFILKQVR
jgi:ribosomal protein S18 acetylase RimI-like enzyme